MRTLWIRTAVMAGALAAVFALAGCSGAKKTSINVYNWGDYIDDGIIEEFEEETGIKVVYSTFATNEEMYTKLKGGGANFDIAIPSDYMISKMVAEGMVEKIDFSNIPNFANIDDRFKNLEYDPTNEYSVPYMWGTLGILYNTKMVQEPVYSWDILWDSKYEKQIYMYNSYRDTIAIALRRLDFSCNTRNISELNAAKNELIKQKPLVRAYWGDQIKDAMASGQGAMGLVFSGDAILAMDMNPDLDYVIPKEGSNVWFDGIVIPKGAKNKKEAEIFINYLCRGDVALRNTEYIGYSTTNTAAFDMLDDELKENHAYWPDDEMIARCEVFLDLGDFIKEFDKAWTEIMAN